MPKNQQFKIISPSDSPILDCWICVFRLPLGTVLEHLFIALLGVQKPFGLLRAHGLCLGWLGRGLFLLAVLRLLLRRLLLLLILLLFLGIRLVLFLLLLRL